MSFECLICYETVKNSLKSQLNDFECNCSPSICVSCYENNKLIKCVFCKKTRNQFQRNKNVLENGFFLYNNYGHGNRYTYLPACYKNLVMDKTPNNYVPVHGYPIGFSPVLFIPCFIIDYNH